MDGDDPDRPRVALQAQQGRLADGLRPRGRVVPHAAEPAGQRQHSQAAAAGRVEQLAEVQDVGHAALAVRQRQQPGRDALVVEQAAEGLDEAVVAPEIVPGLEPPGPRVPCRLVGLQAQQLHRVAAEERGRQRRAHRAAVGRVHHRRDDLFQLRRVHRVQHAGLAVQHAGDAQPAQRRLHPGGLIVGPDQHGDVAGGDRAGGAGRRRARVDLAERDARVELPPDLAGDQPRQLVVGGVGRDAVTFPHRDAAVAPHDEQLEGAVRRGGPASRSIAPSLGLTGWKPIASNTNGRGTRAASNKPLTAATRPGSDR